LRGWLASKRSLQLRSKENRKEQGIKERKETARIKARTDDGCGRNCDVTRDVFFL
jgi:hypothetical protein